MNNGEDYRLDVEDLALKEWLRILYDRKLAFHKIIKYKQELITNNNVTI